MTEYFGTCSKKGRGMAKKSLDLIESMHAIAEAAQPITGRCEIINHAEQESLRDILSKWGSP